MEQPVKESENLLQEIERLENKQSSKDRIEAGMHRFLEEKARKMGVPIHGTFELTPFCNLDCKMCYVHLHHGQIGEKRLLTVTEWKTIMDQAIDAGMLDAAFTGGECLLYPGFDELYLYLESKGVRVAVLTNGILLTEERIRFFKKHPPKGIQISMYGSNDDEYEAVTGQRCFDTVVQHVRWVADAGILYSVAITPNQFMLDGGESLVRFLHGKKIPFTINTSLFAPRAETGRQNSVKDLTPEDYIRLHLLKRSLDGVEVSPISECELPMPAQRKTPMKGLLCSAGKSTFCMTWDGRMLPCNSFCGCEEYPLREGFAVAWNRIKKACCEYPLPQECVECPYRGACPSCVMVHQQDAPVGHASPKVCKRAMLLVQSGLVSLRASN